MRPSAPAPQRERLSTPEGSSSPCRRPAISGRGTAASPATLPSARGVSRPPSAAAGRLSLRALRLKFAAPEVARPMRIKPLTPTIGAIVEDIDLSQPMSNDLFEAVHAAFLKHQVIFF